MSIRARARHFIGPAMTLALLSCETTAICDCLIPVSFVVVEGVVQTSQAQPAPGAHVRFMSGDQSCDAGLGQEPLLTHPDFHFSVLTDGAGQFVTGLASSASGVHCLWVIAREDSTATDSTVVTVQATFRTGSMVTDTASVLLTLPAPSP